MILASRPANRDSSYIFDVALPFRKILHAIASLLKCLPRFKVLNT